MIRRKRNKIHGIKLACGSWCTNPAILKMEAMTYFKNIFCDSDQISQIPHGRVPNVLSMEDRLVLTSPVRNEEVHGALMSMKSYKALGPDGFQPIFFKMFWNDVGEDVCSFVRT